MADKYGIMFAQIPLDNEAFKTTPVPTNAEFVLFATPSSPNSRVEVLSAAITWATIPIDATDPITADLSFHDASADSDTVLQDDYNFKSTNSALVAREATTFWRGNQSLDPGDTLSLIFTTTSPDTAGKGGVVTIAYRVKEWNGE